MTFQAKRIVEVAGPGKTAADRFGNARPYPAEFQEFAVVGWAVNQVEEKAGESVLRTIDRLTVYAPEQLAPGSVIRIPDGTKWQVQGHSEDYNNGPWWSPGLYVIHAIQVRG